MPNPIPLPRRAGDLALTGLVALARSAAGSLPLRGFITVALVALVFSRLQWGTVNDKIAEGRPVFGLLAVASIGAALAIGALRWGRLLRMAGVRLPRRELFRIYAATSFANAFLPTSVGGDIARPLMVSRRGPVLVRAITTVLIERVAAVVALVGLAWVGSALVPESVSGGAFGALAVVSAGLAAVLGALVLWPAALRRICAAVVPQRFSVHLSEAAAVVRGVLRSPRLSAIVMAQSVAFQCLVTLQIVLLARMVGVDLPFGLAAVALALVTLATLIPVSIGGFGVREGSYVVVLAGGGIGHTDAVLISLLSVLALLLATLPGAFELARGGFRPASAELER